MKGVLQVVNLRQHELTASKAQNERIWRAFLRDGTSHSARALTLAYIINRCEREGVGYKLTALPGMGYYIEHQDMEHLKT